MLELQTTMVEFKDTIILVLTLIILRLVTIYLTTTEILYKHLNLIQCSRNLISVMQVYPYGADGLTANATANGIITLSNANATAETGTLTYTRLDTNNYLYATDIGTTCR